MTTTPTPTEKALIRRLQDGRISETHIRWFLRVRGVNGVVRPALQRALQRAVQARFGQTESRFAWAALLAKASGIDVYPYAQRPAGYTRASVWMDPWRYRDGQWQIRWLNDHHPQGIVVCAPDRPAVALFLHGLQARQYNQLKALS